jgi:5-formyltetrahydrofolate cyclo-ligase
MRKPETTPASSEPHAVPADIAARKRQIRGHTLSLRESLPAEQRARLSAAICARAGALPEFVGAATVMLFASFGSEVDTGPLIAQVLRDGKTLCLPRVQEARLMAAYRITDPSVDLVPGIWGIPEPRPGLPEISPHDLDVVIVPGCVFDIVGGRCGYGGGFYDTYLPSTRRGVPRVALAFDLQIVDHLPSEPHDLAVDAIVTETRVIRPG